MCLCWEKKINRKTQTDLKLWIVSSLGNPSLSLLRLHPCCPSVPLLCYGPRAYTDLGHSTILLIVSGGCFLVAMVAQGRGVSSTSRGQAETAEGSVHTLRGREGQRDGSGTPLRFRVLIAGAAAMLGYFFLLLVLFLLLEGCLPLSPDRLTFHCQPAIDRLGGVVCRSPKATCDVLLG